MNGFRRFFKLRNLAAIGVGVGATTGLFVVAHCAAGPAPTPPAWNPALPGNIPDTGFGHWDPNWDLREPRSLFKRPVSSDGETEGKMAKRRATAVRHLILIRHGQYNLNGETDCERTLTPLGIKQAETAGKRLKELGIKYTSLVSSNMARAIQTAELIRDNIGQQGLDISNQDPLLREGAPALPEPPVSHWHPDLHQYYEDGARIEAGFRKYFHRAEPTQTEDSYEIIVCHANVIRYLVCRALQFPGEAWLRMSICHSSLTVLSILPSGRVILRTLGDGGHHPVENVTVS